MIAFALHIFLRFLWNFCSYEIFASRAFRYIFENVRRYSSHIFSAFLFDRFLILIIYCKYIVCIVSKQWKRWRRNKEEEKIMVLIKFYWKCNWFIRSTSFRRCISTDMLSNLCATYLFRNKWKHKAPQHFSDEITKSSKTNWIAISDSPNGILLKICFFPPRRITFISDTNVVFVAFLMNKPRIPTIRN